MSVIQQSLSTKPGLVAYLMAGDGGFDHSLSVMHAYAESGVSVIEVGVPFSDPIADGPTIQAAANRALVNGFSFKEVLFLIEQFKQTYETPVILFTYLNPLMRQGALDVTLKHAKACGVDGCLIVDLPLEAAHDYKLACDRYELDPVFLIAQSTPQSRIEQLADMSGGMLYYVCRQGVTGVRDTLPDDVTARVNQIKSHTTLPVVIGFGISTPAMVRACCDVADGAVIGSFLVDLAHHQSIKQLKSTLTQLVSATREENSI